MYVHVWKEPNRCSAELEVITHVFISETKSSFEFVSPVSQYISIVMNQILGRIQKKNV